MSLLLFVGALVVKGKGCVIEEGFERKNPRFWIWSRIG